MGYKSRINAAKWAAFLDKWKGRDDFGFGKYFELDSQFDKFRFYIDLMGLSASTGKKTLDISAGFGIWAFMVKTHGHIAVTTDVYNARAWICAEAREALELDAAHGLDYHLDGHYQFAPLTVPDEDFDLITAFACAPMSHWDKFDFWRFLNDAFLHLKDDGKILLVPNRSQGFDILFNEITPEFNTEKADPAKGYIIICK